MMDFAFAIMIYDLKQAVAVIGIKRTENFANFSLKCNNCAWLCIVCTVITTCLEQYKTKKQVLIQGSPVF